MAPMRRLAALALLAAPAITAVAAAGCGTQYVPMPATCTDTNAAGYARALRAAPADVRLPGGTRISECLHRVRDDAELQNLGAILFRTAERQATLARERRDPGAALRLGYLAGAVHAGAGGTAGGPGAELVNRIDRPAASLLDGGALERAVRRGIAAGEARG
jgi:hypothetical protein